MNLMEIKDLLINKDEIEYANKDNNSIIIKVKKSPYVLYVDYDSNQELEIDFDRLKPVEDTDENYYGRITA
jgi:hypothetical protein